MSKNYPHTQLIILGSACQEVDIWKTSPLMQGAFELILYSVGHIPVTPAKPKPHWKSKKNRNGE